MLPIMQHIPGHMLTPWLSCCLGRINPYALQQDDGSYPHAREPLTYEVLMHHLQGLVTIATYVIGGDGLCNFAVYDSDAPDGLLTLSKLQTTLGGLGVKTYQELSRRGSHLWVFMARRYSPALIRSVLLPYCPAGVEFFPNQDALTPARPYGTKIRLPLGIHRKSGHSYPFVTLCGTAITPLFTSTEEGLTWFTTVERILLPSQPHPSPIADNPINYLYPSKKTPNLHNVGGMLQSHELASTRQFTIADWCQAQDPVAVISRYVTLDANGSGCCPFGWHHDDGVDSRPSFFVYAPTPPNISCWYCRTWKQGGSLFDFLRYFHGWSARELWHRLLCGERF